MEGNKMELSAALFPLITVVIASYNYGRYINKAIDSVLGQTYPGVELIVIDDGSTDNTRSIVAAYPSVRYFFHSNRGVSASRNAGIKAASGHYISFLDADDWLEKTGLEQNYRVIRKFPEMAFVSGNFCLLHAETNEREFVRAQVEEGHYARLLRSNYIGMLASVLFKKPVLNKFFFDESLAACEDYDLFLRIARDHPIMHHPGLIATYNHHVNSLSHNYPLMMQTINTVLKKQKDSLRNDEEKTAYEVGLTQWREYEDLSTKNQ